MIFKAFHNKPYKVESHVQLRGDSSQTYSEYLKMETENKGLINKLFEGTKNLSIVVGQSLLEGYSIPTFLWGIGFPLIGIAYISGIWNAQGVIDAAGEGQKMISYYTNVLPKYVIGYGGTALSGAIFSTRLLKGVNNSASNIKDMWKGKDD